MLGDCLVKLPLRQFEILLFGFFLAVLITWFLDDLDVVIQPNVDRWVFIVLVATRDNKGTEGRVEFPHGIATIAESTHWDVLEDNVSVRGLAEEPFFVQ